jgi:hypothetical protein
VIGFSGAPICGLRSPRPSGQTSAALLRAPAQALAEPRTSAESCPSYPVVWNCLVPVRFYGPDGTGQPACQQRDTDGKSPSQATVTSACTIRAIRNRCLPEYDEAMRRRSAIRLWLLALPVRGCTARFAQERGPGAPPAGPRSLSSSRSGRRAVALATTGARGDRRALPISDELSLSPPMRLGWRL